jgi:hypothetical protein
MSQVDRAPIRGRVSVDLSPGAAAFLVGVVRHMNQAKILPADNAQALESSAWLEEIEAATTRALEADHA